MEKFLDGRKKSEPGTWKPGDKFTLKVIVTPNHFKPIIAGEEVAEVDAKNLAHRIGGVDSDGENLECCRAMRKFSTDAPQCNFTW